MKDQKLDLYLTQVQIFHLFSHYQVERWWSATSLSKCPVPLLLFLPATGWSWLINEMLARGLPLSHQTGSRVSSQPVLILEPNLYISTVKEVTLVNSKLVSGTNILLAYSRKLILEDRGWWWGQNKCVWMQYWQSQEQYLLRVKAGHHSCSNDAGKWATYDDLTLSSLW